ncbi:MAG: cation transporter [Burkholderiales bacterium]|nr:cation transporter [Burkholderiales bacterium]
MSASCTEHCAADTPGSPAYRRVLWVALWVNAGMFAVELASGWAADSAALLADAADFFGDAANYAISLAVLAMAPVWRSRAALLKGLSMAAYGLFVLVKAGVAAAGGSAPEPVTMGVIALLALAANVTVAWLLFRFRQGDANMRSVWLCSRNDAIGNVAVLFAALGVFGTGAAWPDLLVAAIMAALALSAGWVVARQARAELRDYKTAGISRVSA